MMKITGIEPVGIGGTWEWWGDCLDLTIEICTENIMIDTIFHELTEASIAKVICNPVRGNCEHWKCELCHTMTKMCGDFDGKM